MLAACTYELLSSLQAEVNYLGQLSHSNLVKLIGYLEEGNERIVVEEYVPNGNLRQHLNCKCILVWGLLICNVFGSSSLVLIFSFVFNYRWARTCARFIISSTNCNWYCTCPHISPPLCRFLFLSRSYFWDIVIY